MGAMHYFFHYELPKIAAWLQVVSARDADLRPAGPKPSDDRRTRPSWRACRP